LVLAASNAVYAQKLSPEDIISKHVASIGTPETLAKAKGRLAIGTSEFITRSPRVTTSGRVVIASDGVDFAFHATFDTQNYRMERIGLFTNKVSIPFLKEGYRSPLGGFLFLNDTALTDRLFCGPLLSTWHLFNVSTMQGKFETEGKKKVKDRDTWVVRYVPKSGMRDGSSIKFYFDSETFRLVRSVYYITEADKGFYPINTNGDRGNGGTPLTSAMGQSSHVLTEDFDDYKVVNGLTLPHKYSIDLILNGANGTNNFKWNFNIVEHRLVNDFGKGFFAFTV